MDFNIAKSLDILERTPAVLTSMLQNIAPEWTSNNEGGESWAVYDIIGHLIHGEKTDWVPRAAIILSTQPDKKFEPFDRFAQMQQSQENTLEQLLDEFSALREANIAWLRSGKITTNDFTKKGIHPVFGEVTLSQLLATWTVHDLNHIAQISRVMAAQYKEAVGPWTAFLKILQS
ncbi:MAG: DinB family protein [Chitinophagaceae bacterium]